MLFLTLSQGRRTLPTVASRCQRVRLRPLPFSQIAEALEKQWQVLPERADLLARLSQGRFGWAMNMLQDDTAWNLRSQRLDDLQSLRKQGRVERMRYAEQMSRLDPSVVEGVLNVWSSWWRDLALMQNGCPRHVANVDQMAALRAEATRYDTAQAWTFLETLAGAGLHLQQNVNSRLVLEMLLLRMPQPLPETSH